jgi:hypothetical protein
MNSVKIDEFFIGMGNKITYNKALFVEFNIQKHQDKHNGTCSSDFRDFFLQI